MRIDQTVVRDQEGLSPTTQPPVTVQKDLLWFSPLTPSFHPLFCGGMLGGGTLCQNPTLPTERKCRPLRDMANSLSIQSELSFRTEVLVLLAGPKAPE